MPGPVYRVLGLVCALAEAIPVGTDRRLWRRQAAATESDGCPSRHRQFCRRRLPAYPRVDRNPMLYWSRSNPPLNWQLKGVVVQCSTPRFLTF
jgi:hypothetical protein